MPAAVINLLLNPPAPSTNRQSNASSGSGTDFDEQLKTAQQATQASNSGAASNSSPPANATNAKQSKASGTSSATAQKTAAGVKQKSADETDSATEEEQPPVAGEQQPNDQQPENPEDDPSSLVMAQQKVKNPKGVLDLPDEQMFPLGAAAPGSLPSATLPVAKATEPTRGPTIQVPNSPQVQVGPAKQQIPTAQKQSAGQPAGQQAASDSDNAPVDLANQEPAAQIANSSTNKSAQAASSKPDQSSASTSTAANSADSTTKTSDTSNPPASIPLDSMTAVAAALTPPTAAAPAQSATGSSAPATNSAAAVSSPARFADTNHANIVTAVHSSLLPKGGTMQIRLDPPELGTLQVNVDVRNGVVNATFQTSNDDATRLLSHSLGQLKTALEAQGVSVEKIQVQQTPKDEKSQNNSQGQSQDDRSQQQQQSDQDRRENLRRMWRRISGQNDPLDLVA